LSHANEEDRRAKQRNKQWTLLLERHDVPNVFRFLAPWQKTKIDAHEPTTADYHQGANRYFV
jgi:hypothetical protein